VGERGVDALDQTEVTDRTVFVYLQSRPCDKGESWPVVCQEIEGQTRTARERAEADEHRVSEVAEVCFREGEAA
jgi:hypothetical protein